MNDKIKDAWEKAAQAHSGDSWAEQTAFLEKFAELIVRECLDIVDDEGGHEGGSIRATKKIKEHFGVKE